MEGRSAGGGDALVGEDRRTSASTSQRTRLAGVGHRTEHFVSG